MGTDIMDFLHRYKKYSKNVTHIDFIADKTACGYLRHIENTSLTLCLFSVIKPDTEFFVFGDSGVNLTPHFFHNIIIKNVTLKATSFFTPKVKITPPRFENCVLIGDRFLKENRDEKTIVIN